LIVIAWPPAFALALILNGAGDDRLSAFGHIDMLDCYRLLAAVSAKPDAAGFIPAITEG
jgi:hypothetical protein